MFEMKVLRFMHASMVLRITHRDGAVHCVTQQYRILHASVVLRTVRA